MISIRTLPNKSVCIGLSFTLLLLQLSPAFSREPTLQEVNCETLLNQAESQYHEGRFDEAIGLLNDCLDSPQADQSQKERAYKLLGQTYQAKGFLNQAKENLHKLLDLLPNWRPDPNTDPPSFQALAKEVIEEAIAEKQTEAEGKVDEGETAGQDIPPQKSGRKKWLLVAGGVGLATGVFLALSGGGNDGISREILSLPPELPNPPGQ